MRTRLLRPLRLGVPTAAVLALALTGCTEPAAPAPAPAAPSTPAASGSIDPGTSTTGTDGLTVRYLDGTTVKTVRVEDFR